MRVIKIFCLIGFFILIFNFCRCSSPEQSTSPGEFGHIIYQRDNGSWIVTGMYINDSLVVMGNPRHYQFHHPIVNIKTGKVVDEIIYDTEFDRIKIKGDNNIISH